MLRLLLSELQLWQYIAFFLCASLNWTPLHSIKYIAIVFFKHSLRAARELHDKMAHRVVHATMAWFEATPSGRLINRFSQDISTIDTSVMSRLQVRTRQKRFGWGNQKYLCTRPIHFASQFLIWFLLSFSFSLISFSLFHYFPFSFILFSSLFL